MTTRSVPDRSVRHENVSRRNFLAGATAAAAGLLVVEPRQVAAAEANSKITLGLIGCGGRGNWIADLFQQHGGYQFVATADYFPDRATAAAQRLGVAENRAFSGLSGYKRLLDARPDAIVIISPPYFHPEQAMAGVDAGCHVYCAKPIAVDVPGCQTIADAGRKGTEKKRVVLIDFQTRTSEFYQEAVRRVHAGDIGNVVSGEAVYYGGPLWEATMIPTIRKARSAPGGWTAFFPATRSPNSSSMPWTLPPGSPTRPPSRPTARAARTAATTPARATTILACSIRSPRTCS